MNDMYKVRAIYTDGPKNKKVLIVTDNYQEALYVYGEAVKQYLKEERNHYTQLHFELLKDGFVIKEMI